MKHRKIVAAVIAVAVVTLAACSTADTDKFIERIGNFTRGVEAVDAAVAKVSATLYARCKTIQTIAQAADDITGTCTKASPVVTAGNAIIRSYCQAEQVTDIASALAATAATISATKTQLDSAKKSCAAGG